MIPASFEYHRPRSLDEAIAILASHGDDIRIVAGGHSLIPMMKLRLAQPGHLVDLQDLGELRGIDAGSTIVIGAMTTQHALITSAALAATVPLLGRDLAPDRRSAGALLRHPRRQRRQR